MPHCTIIGITDNPAPWFPPEVAKAISCGKTFSGGRRHHEIVSRFLPQEHEWIEIVPPLGRVFERYDQVEGELVLFASGDPLFYGFAATVRRERPTWELTVFPTFHSLQMLAHRLCLPYQDMRAVSLTGRSWNGLDEALISGESLIGCLTDHQRTPQTIWERLERYGYDRFYTMSVGERLGNPHEERVTADARLEMCDLASGKKEESSSVTFFPEREHLRQGQMCDFQSPNCVILRRKAVRPRPFGIPEKDFYHLDGRENMITKMPARLLALSLLDLHHRRTLWDVGFCTGSVSIEAKLQHPHLNVVSFEVRAECEQLMALNSQRHGTPGIRTVMGDFLSADLGDVPRPDSVFVGGHGGRLREIVHRLHPLMLPGATLVFNAVAGDSAACFEQSVREEGMMLVSQTRLAVDDHNPLTIMKAVKCAV